MNWSQKSRVRVLVLAAALAVFLSSCSIGPQDKLWVKSESWSRAITLGETSLAGPVPAQVNEAGEVFSVIFQRLNEENNLFIPQIVRLNDQGEIDQRVDLDIQIPKPGDAAVVLVENGFDLYWIGNSTLQTARVDPHGKLTRGPLVLSGDDYVSSFSLDQLGDGIVLSYSGSREHPGAVILAGEVGHLQRTVLDLEGIRVSQTIDQEGQLHLSWIRYPVNYGVAELFYLETDTQAIDPTDRFLIHSLNLTPAIRITGPVLGFDEQLGYIFWSMSIISGLDTGVQNSYVQYFPIDRPDAVRPPIRVAVPYSQNIKPERIWGEYFDVGERVRISGSIPLTTFQDNVAVLPGRYPELAFTFRSHSEYKWRDIRYQVNVAYFKDGLLTSYQPLSYTPTESMFPTIFQDAEGNLYVSWLEKTRAGFNAYITTTDPGKRAVLDQVSWNDYFYLLASGIFGVLAGVILSPFAAAVWGGIGLIGFIFLLILSQFNKPIYRKIGEVLSMATGIGVFWFMKLATLPGLKDLDYVPFSAWIPHIPDRLTTPLLYGVPILILMAGLIIAYFNTYGKKNDSPIYFYLLYCAVDALLSCAVYGILIYGSF